MEETININVEIKFPFQYIEKYVNGEMNFEAACDSTIEECYRLIEEYIEKNTLKT